MSTGAASRRKERRPDLIRQRREERLRIAEKQKRQRQLRLGAIALTAVVLLGLLSWAIVNWNEDRETNVALEGVVTYDGVNVQSGHEDGVALTYGVDPPVGGIHNSVWQNCGFYAAPINNENGVHSMEHGAVWITYRPDLPADQIEKLKELANESYVLVSAYPNLPAPIVLSSWGHQLYVTTPDDSGVEAYLDEYRRNPEFTPEVNGTCDGGTSATKQ